MTNFKKYLKFILVYIVILLSGDVKYHINDKLILILSFIIVMSILFILWIKKGMQRIKILLVLIICIILFFVMILNNDLNQFESYMGIILRICIAGAISSLVNYDDFTIKFRTIISLLAMTSLLFYIIGVVDTNFRYLFPIISDTANQRYGNAILYSYNLTEFLPVLYRNNGIFNEAGVYQVYLNMALFFELKENSFNKKKQLLLLVITIITTKSTAGYIIMIIIIINNLIINYNIKKIKKGLLLIPIVLLIFSSMFFDVISSKFQNNNKSYVRRNADIDIDIELLKKDPLFGVGFSTYRYEFPERLADYSFEGQSMSSSLSSSANGLTRNLAINGAILNIFLLVLYNNFLKKNCSKNFVSHIFNVIVFLIIFNTQDFFLSAFFLVFIFYGLNHKNSLLIQEKINFK